MRTNVSKNLRRSLLTAIIEKGKIETTLARAKSVQDEIDKLINLAKDGSISARRLTVKTLATDRFFRQLAKGFEDRKSGYSRIIKLGEGKVIFELIKDKKDESNKTS